MKLYIDPQLADRGFSTVKGYEDDDGYVSMGGTNCGEPALLVNFNLLAVEIFAGKKEYDEWVAICELTDHRNYPNAFMWRLFFRAIAVYSDSSASGGSVIKEIVKTAYTTGVKDGREEKRLEFVRVLKGYGFGET